MSFLSVHVSFAAAAIRCSTFLACLLSAACMTVRRGQETPLATYAKASPFYIHGDLGLGSPEGFIGAGVGLAPTSWLNAELGAGLGSGPQAAAMLSAHFAAGGHTRLGLSSGVSFGPKVHSVRPFADSEGISYDKQWDWVLWSNSEVTLRAPIGANTAMRYHIGVAVPAAKASDPVCTILWEGEDECAADELSLVPYIALGIEQHF